MSTQRLLSKSLCDVSFFYSIIKGQGAALRCSENLGGADRDRTDDLRLAKPALSQLSYGPGFDAAQVGWRGDLVGQGRLELPTSRLSGVRSNHLSYWPDLWTSGSTGPSSSSEDETARSLETESYAVL